MKPAELFCPNMTCPARGPVGKGNIPTHSLKDKRWICDVCKQTFATPTGTLFDRLRCDPQVVMWVMILLAYGGSIQAIVQAFLLDERRVPDWQKRAGQHGQQVHEQLVENSQQDLEPVQADQIQAKTQPGTLWMALAIWVPTRLWMGGVVRPKRDLDLIQAWADQVRQMALCRPLLLAVDGLARYVSAFRDAVRSKFPRPAGETGRCQMVSWSGIFMVPVVKPRLPGVLNVERRIVPGAPDMVASLIQKTPAPGMINTAFIECLHATLRQRISPLTRRTRNVAQQAETLVAGRFIVGCLYNFCDDHHSQRLKLWVGSLGYRWVPRHPSHRSHTD